MVRRHIRKLHFKNKIAYHKWLAFGHLHVKDFGKRPTPEVLIHGRFHKVKHVRRRKR